MILKRKPKDLHFKFPHPSSCNKQGKLKKVDMRQEIVTVYKTTESLKRKIISQYVDFLKSNILTCKNILGNKDWASSGSEYHVNCRIEMGKEIIECEKQIRELKSP